MNMTHITHLWYPSFYHQFFLPCLERNWKSIFFRNSPSNEIPFQRFRIGFYWFSAIRLATLSDACTENLTWFFGGWGRSFGFDITNRRFEVNIHITLDNIYCITWLFTLSINHTVDTVWSIYQHEIRSAWTVDGLISFLCFNDLEFVFFSEIINTDHIIFGKTCKWPKMFFKNSFWICYIKKINLLGLELWIRCYW